jgi:purine nucleosidase
VWHDCDSSHDDALALAMLTASEAMSNCSLIGVSTVGGNIELPKCTMNARKIMKLANFSNTNVYPGSSKPLLREPRYCKETECTGLDGTTTLSNIILED